MLANNNQGVIRRMTKRSLKGNRGRSLIIFFAVFLSAFLLFSIFTVGITYFHMYQLQNIRMSGAEFDAILYGVTDQQLKQCQEDPDVTETGIAAVAGGVTATPYDDTVSVGLVWADDTYWNEMVEPARLWMKGTYPQKENEILVTERALKKCGAPGLQIGDVLKAEYVDGTGEPKTKEFRISGIWEGYGDQSLFYVSEAFYQQSGYEISDVSSGRFHINFRQKIMTEGEQQAFIDSLELGKQQRLFFSVNLGESLPIFLGLCGIALVTCFCAYLLIYNILYLSVAGNVRYYGLLQTVGMTGQQIRSFLRTQMLFLGGAGLAGGLLAGSGVAFFLIPSVVQSLGIHTKAAGNIEVTFHPAVFFLTILLTGLTVFIGSRKPAKMAANVSPIEALGYRPADGKRDSRKTGKGRLLGRMALGQLGKDKKKTAVITLSLATGLSVFLCLVTLIQSQGPRTFVSNYMDMDMTVENDTLKKEDHDAWKQILDEEILAQIAGTDGVTEAHPVRVSEIMIPWEPDFADAWMREEYAMWMRESYENDVKEYQEHPENFGTFLVGIDETDFAYMQENMDISVDREDFLAGKTCVLYRNDLEFENQDLVGKTVTCADYGNGDKTKSFEIAGLTDESYYAGPMLGLPPAVIVSAQALETFDPDAYVSKVSLRYEESYDEETEAALVSLMDASPNAKAFSYSSKIEEAKTVEKAQGNMMEVGIGIAAILALIGILNYVNTVIGNIQSRQQELAILESIGMTGKQRNRLLLLEGLCYALLSLLLTGTAGLGVTYAVYQSMNYMGAPFAVPLWPVAALSLVIGVLCMLTPVAVGRKLAGRGSVIERVGTEDF